MLAIDPFGAPSAQDVGDEESVAVGRVAAEAADDEAVAQTLVGREGTTPGTFCSALERVGELVLQHLLRHHLHRERRLHQRRVSVRVAIVALVTV